jgi:signal transduction histidine kinase
LQRRADDKNTVLKISQSILNSARSMQKIIEDLLELSRVDACTFSLTKKWVDAEAVGLQICSSQSLTAQDKGIQLIIELTGSVFCDPNRLAQALLNLVGNSLKFTEHGQVIVRGMRHDDRYMIFVEDTGMGMSRTDLPHVFDRFWQSDENTQRTKGTGLGLAIVKGIVEAHNGTISVESVVNKGSRFTIEVPNPSGVATGSSSS